MPNDPAPSGDHGHKSVTLLAIGLLVFTLFQLSMVFTDRLDLIKIKVELDKAVATADQRLDEGSKMLDKLNDVAIATQKLANAGNGNARDIVAQLNKAGIKIATERRKPPTEKPAEKAPAANPPAEAPPAEKPPAK